MDIKTIGNKFVKWFSARKASYSAKDALNHFSERNNFRVVEPFLDGLKVNYLIIDNLVLVKSFLGFNQVLESLNFNLVYDVLPNVKRVINLLNRFDSIADNQYYNIHYNIHILVIKDTDRWENACRAKQIALNIGTMRESLIPLFVTIYNSLNLYISPTKPDPIGPLPVMDFDPTKIEVETVGEVKQKRLERNNRLLEEQGE